MSTGPWMSFIVHPQVPNVCDAYGVLPWPEDGFDGPYVIGSREAITLWPVPCLKGARLVDCRHCGKTGIQARTAEDLVRYIPGARLEDCKIILANVLDPVQLPDGSGRDEETVSDGMVDRALAVLDKEWEPPYPYPNPGEYLIGAKTEYERIKQIAALRQAGEAVELKTRDLVRRAVKAALEGTQTPEESNEAPDSAG